MKRIKVGLLCFALAACGGDESGSGDDGGSDGSGAQQDGAGGDGSSADGASGADGADQGDGAGDDGSPGDGSSGDGSGDGSVGDPDGGTPSGEVTLPPANAGLDYQLGGAYPPADGVRIVSRDREAEPAAGLYNLCYVNGYQVQPGEESDWEQDLILRDEQGQPVIDEDWNEAILDVGSADKRTRIAEVVGGWIDGCLRAGFDAVEIDNLDTYSRSGGRLTEDDAVSFMALLSQRAHAAGLAIAQKNSAELLARRGELGTDFAVVEECSRYDECGDFVAAYGDGVLMIEYRQNDFTKGCSDFGESHSIVLRDVPLRPAGESGYVFDGC